MAENLIEVRNLSIEFPLRNGILHVVNNVDFDIPKGKITALVGESGSGKSTMAMALLKVVSTPGIIKNGNVFFNGKDVLKFNNEELINYKWVDVAMVFQAAQNALNPVMLIKDQMIETAKAHKKDMTEEQIIKKATELLEFVRLEPSRVLSAYPHELSGGMKQRVMIAFSLLLDPELLILDEPTTALDVITQDYIFDILVQIHKKLNITMLLLTHDIGIVAKVADRIGVMYAGNIVEVGDVHTIFKKPSHPYTANLINAAPSLIDEFKNKKAIIGSPPDLFNVPTGCSFRERCEIAKEKCDNERPCYKQIKDGHIAACHFCIEYNTEVE
ncbi:ABC transporter ATP-binding protein [Clostridium sp. YIM B02515]|uniref:ABC transporter ATP-binding protein n=1 Tax=Clostridium rhizosphaerae TaxID=2803861 RepID=A0ABS1T9V2_9CLOT|nr:ABC transporter ATP-binding protein [Clostridium rhizosphaerae]MBL4935877.1 ABC transporter ATP-binding protein [Clostridium rhizosphaerae]